MAGDRRAASATGALWPQVQEAFEVLEAGDLIASRSDQWERLTGQERLLWRLCQAAVEEEAAGVLDALWSRQRQASARAFLCWKYGEAIWHALWGVVACAQVAVQAKRYQVDGLLTWAQRAAAGLGAPHRPGSPSGPVCPLRDSDPAALVSAVYTTLGPPDGSQGAARDLTLALLGQERTVLRFLRVGVLGCQHQAGFVATLLLELLADGGGAWYPDSTVMAFTPMGVAFRQALDTAWRYSQTQVGLPTEYDLRWRLEGQYLQELEGASIGAAAAVGLRCVVAGKPCHPSVGMTGEVDTHGRLHGVQYVAQKVQAAARHGLSRVIVPLENAREARAGAPAVVSLFTAATVEEAVALATAPERITLEVDTLHNGQMVRDEDLPLRIEGRYAAQGQVHVWVVLQDAYGHFYLQNPDVMFLPTGRWIASNIVPGLGIEFVHFVAVGEQGHRHFQQMVAHEAWGAFDALPADSTLLHAIRIVRVQDTAPTPSSGGPVEPRAGVTPLTLEVDTLQDGQTIREEELPLQIEGRYAAPSAVWVWVVLQDIYGRLYLQHPPVMFLPTGRWVASNILPGLGIAFIHFVVVGEQGHAHFRQMVARHEWGAFETLPADSTLLQTIRISRVRGTSC